MEVLLLAYSIEKMKEIEKKLKNRSFGLVVYL